jgi:hypothetical protein
MRGDMKYRWFQQLHRSTFCTHCPIMILVLHRGLRTGEQHKVVAKLNEMGVNITITRLDVANVDEARQLVDLAEGQAPLAIIFHLAMVLDDRLLMKQVGFRGQPLTSAGHGLAMSKNVMRLSSSCPGPVSQPSCCLEKLMGTIMFTGW